MSRKAEIVIISQDAEHNKRKAVTLEDVIRQLIDSFSLTEAANRLMQDAFFGLEKQLRIALNGYFTQLAQHVHWGIQDLLRDVLENYQITKTEAISILRKYKWPVSSSMPAVLLFEAVEIGRREGNQRGAVNRLFVEYYSADNFATLEDMVGSWKRNPLLLSRMKILKDCVATLKYADGRYNAANVVLPTLIAQIDGLLNEYTSLKKISRASKKWKEQFRVATGDEHFSELANDILLDIVFQKAIPGLPLAVPFNFNRHKVMHGEYTTYGRIDNAIRAFLILDFLANLEDVIQN